MGCSSSRNVSVIETDRSGVHQPSLTFFRNTHAVGATSIPSEFGRRYGDIHHADREILQLQSDLEILEHLFQLLLGQSFVTDFFGNSDTTFQPAASERVIKNLFETNVSEADLQYEGNKECCVCFIEYELGQSVCRLPCGHNFHRDCVSEWLRKKCSCPTCRFEIQTDNPIYEKSRVERMKSRTLRFRSDEIPKMTITQLQDATDESCENRDHLMELLANRVEWINKPTPVESTL